MICIIPSSGFLACTLAKTARIAIERVIEKRMMLKDVENQCQPDDGIYISMILATIAKGVA